MQKGWVKLHRQLADHELWLESEFSRGQAWVDLMMLANHKPGYIRVRGVRVEIGRGELGWSAAKLAIRWRWSRGRVLRFLNELETVQQIEQQNGQPINIITICKYDEYQGEESASGTTDSTADGTTNGLQTEQQTVQQTVQQTDTNKNVKNEKNVKNKRKSAKFSADDAAFACEFSEMLAKVNPRAKIPDSLSRWADAVRLMRERDGLDIAEIRAVATWALQDDFWSSNILSTTKLRQKYAMLYGQMNRKKPDSANQSTTDPRDYENKNYHTDLARSFGSDAA